MLTQALEGGIIVVKFERTPGGFSVKINGKLFGHIDTLGFFTDATVIREFTRVSAKDLRAIADKVEEASK